MQLEVLPMLGDSFLPGACVNKITGMWIDEAAEFDWACIDRAIKLAKRNAVSPRIGRDGLPYYCFVIEPRAEHDLKCAQARSDWYDYYRAVRTLRRIRQPDVARFQRFSQAWYRGFYKSEIEATQWPRPQRRERKLP